MSGPPSEDPAGTYVRVWPVTDTARTVRELADEAIPDLEWALRKDGLHPTGTAHWAVRPGRSVPGSRGAYLVLLVVVPVASERWPDPHAATDRAGKMTRAEVQAEAADRREYVLGEVAWVIGTDDPDRIAHRLGYSSVASLARTLDRWGAGHLARRLETSPARYSMSRSA